jgi:hypothetical protein
VKNTGAKLQKKKQTHKKKLPQISVLYNTAAELVAQIIYRAVEFVFFGIV